MHTSAPYVYYYCYHCTPYEYYYYRFWCVFTHKDEIMPIRISVESNFPNPFFLALKFNYRLSILRYSWRKRLIQAKSRISSERRSKIGICKEVIYTDEAICEGDYTAISDSEWGAHFAHDSMQCSVYRLHMNPIKIFFNNIIDSIRYNSIPYRASSNGGNHQNTNR